MGGLQDQCMYLCMYSIYTFTVGLCLFSSRMSLETCLIIFVRYQYYSVDNVSLSNMNFVGVESIFLFEVTNRYCNTLPRSSDVIGSIVLGLKCEKLLS